MHYTSFISVLSSGVVGPLKCISIHFRDEKFKNIVNRGGQFKCISSHSTGVNFKYFLQLSRTV